MRKTACVVAVLALALPASAQAATVHGKTVNGKCRVTVTMRLPAGFRAISNSTSVNFKTCTATVHTSKPHGTAQLAVRSTAVARAWFVHNGFVENSNINQLTWTHNGVRAFDGVCRWNFTKLSFWTLSGRNHFCRGENAGSRIHSEQIVTFHSPRNGFCRGGAATNTGERTDLFGLANGSAVARFTFAKNGGCVGQLFSRHSLVR